MKKLANLDGALDKFFDRIEPPKPRIGVILWRLPPILHQDLPRLDALLKLLPHRYRHAVEFRHKSWLEDKVFEVLRSHRTVTFR